MENKNHPISPHTRREENSILDSLWVTHRPALPKKFPKTVSMRRSEALFSVYGGFLPNSDTVHQNNLFRAQIHPLITISHQKLN